MATRKSLEMEFKAAGFLVLDILKAMKGHGCTRIPLVFQMVLERN